MVHPACLDVSRLSLQILLNNHPQWRSLPVALVSENTPLGIVLQTNRVADETAVSRGMRYAAALAICPTLQAGVIDPEELQSRIDECIAVLCRYSPQVEECSFDPGSFWLDAKGLGSLYRSPVAWISAIRAAIAEVGFFCRICVGFSRFGTYAGAKSGIRVFHSSSQERRWTRAAPVTLLPLAPQVEERLEKLGIKTVGEFCALSREGIASRFGTQTAAVYRLATEDDTVPIQGVEAPPEFHSEAVLFSPVTNKAQLIAEIEALLLDLLSQTVAVSLYLRQVEIQLIFEDGSHTRELLRPASPARDAAIWLRLLRLRLETFSSRSAVCRISVRGDAAAAVQPQSDLFETQEKRDPSAAARVFAALRARFGNGVVCRAVLQPEHRPDRRFVLLPLDRPAMPSRLPVAGLQLVRRIFDNPVELTSHHSLRPAAGPFVVSGKWWEQEAERHYYYAHRGRSIVWIYYDSGTHHWMMQGTVE